MEKRLGRPLKLREEKALERKVQKRVRLLRDCNTNTIDGKKKRQEEEEEGECKEGDIRSIEGDGTIKLISEEG